MNGGGSFVCLASGSVDLSSVWLRMSIEVGSFVCLAIEVGSFFCLTSDQGIFRLSGIGVDFFCLSSLGTSQQRRSTTMAKSK